MPDDIFADDEDVFVDTDDLTPEDDVEEDIEEDTSNSDKDEEDTNTEDESTDDESEDKDDDKELKNKDKSVKDKNTKEDDPFAEHKYTRPQYKQITKEFPDLFKKFPALKTAYFREKSFTDIYPRVEDAQLAAQKATMYDTAAGAILSGEAKDFIGLLTDSNNEDTVKSFANTFVPALYSHDKELFNTVIVEPITTRLINRLASDGKKFNNEALSDAAKVLSAYLYDSEEIPKIKNPEPAAKKDDKESYWHERAEEFTRDTKLDGYNQAFSLVKEQITDLAKQAGLAGRKAQIFAQEVFNDVDDVLAKDERYQRQIASLFADSKRKGFNRQHSQRIVNAYISRVKAVLPMVKAKHAKELKVEKKVDSNNTSTRPTGSKRPAENTNFDVSKVDWSKTTDADWMNRDKNPERVHYKK